MRNIINISLPADMTKYVEAEVKAHQFASKSEFFRHLICQRQQQKILRDVSASRSAYKVGKAKKLKSIDRLWE